jgi:hypothetical protein
MGVSVNGGLVPDRKKDRLAAVGIIASSWTGAQATAQAAAFAAQGHATS